MFPEKKAVNSGFSFSIATRLSGEKSLSLFSNLSSRLWAIRTLLSICGAFYHLLLFPMEVVTNPIKSSLWWAEQLKLYPAWHQDPFKVAPCRGRCLSLCLHFLSLDIWLHGASLLCYSDNIHCVPKACSTHLLFKKKKFSNFHAQYMFFRMFSLIS